MANRELRRRAPEPEEMEVTELSEDEKIPRASVEREPLADDDGFWEAEIADVMDSMGVSGKILTAQPNKELWDAARVAVQAFTIQFIILAYIYEALLPLPKGEVKDLPKLILYGAIYLHVISCIQDMPFCLQVCANMSTIRRRYFLHKFKVDDDERQNPLPAANGDGAWKDENDNEITAEDLIKIEKWAGGDSAKVKQFGDFAQPRWYHTAAAWPIFLIDSFVVPGTTMVLGGIFLCTSRDAPEVILNSCGVVFITSIDNYILSLQAKISKLTGAITDGKVKIPFAKHAAKTSMLLLLDAPIVPLVISYTLMYVGLDVMKL